MLWTEKRREKRGAGGRGWGVEKAEKEGGVGWDGVLWSGGTGEITEGQRSIGEVGAPASSRVLKKVTFHGVWEGGEGLRWGKGGMVHEHKALRGGIGWGGGGAKGAT